MDFKSGKWILNEPYTNYKDLSVYNTAKEEFQEILGDSLLELVELRNTRIIGDKLPLHPTPQALEEIKKLSDCDYLINIESNILSDDLGNIGTSNKHVNPSNYNKGETIITIYHLPTAGLISEAIATGIVEEKQAEEDESFLESLDYTTGGKQLALKTLKKLIRKYKNHQIK